jgi:hypothetical protein
MGKVRELCVCVCVCVCVNERNIERERERERCMCACMITRYKIKWLRLQQSRDQQTEMKPENDA